MFKEKIQKQIQGARLSSWILFLKRFAGPIVLKAEIKINKKNISTNNLKIQDTEEQNEELRQQQHQPNNFPNRQTEKDQAYRW